MIIIIYLEASHVENARFVSPKRRTEAAGLAKRLTEKMDEDQLAEWFRQRLSRDIS